MANHGRSGVVWFALAMFVFLLVAGCADFFPSANLTSITVFSATNGSATPSVNVGSTVQMAARGTFDNGNTSTITATWSVTPSDNSIASITAGGLVTGVAPGTATVTAESQGISGTASVTVCGNITSIAISPLSQTITLGTGVLQFTAKDQGGNNVTSSVTWSSSSSAVATISNTSGTNGLATLQGTGTTTIGATSCLISSSTPLNVD